MAPINPKAQQQICQHSPRRGLTKLQSCAMDISCLLSNRKAMVPTTQCTAWLGHMEVPQHTIITWQMGHRARCLLGCSAICIPLLLMWLTRSLVVPHGAGNQGLLPPGCILIKTCYSLSSSFLFCSVASLLNGSRRDVGQILPNSVQSNS